MDSFMDICIKDGGLTDAGERACVLVYERITDKCWHRIMEVTKDITHSEYGTWFHATCACGESLVVTWNDHKEDVTPYWQPNGKSRAHLDANPSLTTSLDAWMPLWEAMDNELMAELFGMRVSNRHLLDPMWWLEASLRACGLYEKW